MSTMSKDASPGTTAAETTRRSLLQGAAVGATVATLLNAALWAGGRAADASFLATTGDTTTEVGIVLVVVTTALTFAVGIGLFALAARRSRRWVRAVLVAAAFVAVVSTGGPASAAHDAATGVLLVGMHLVTGAAFLATALWVEHR
jgi:hypothetical protein